MSMIWINGTYYDDQAPHISYRDAGFSNGLGIFDVMRVKDGMLENPDLHFARLLHDCNVVLGYGASWLPSFADLTQIWEPLLVRNGHTRGTVRLRTTITGGIVDAPLKTSAVPTIIISSAHAAAPDSYTPITCAIIRDFPRVAGDALENCKRMDYSRSFAARRMAQERRADDAIVINTQGRIACGATSTLFIQDTSDGPLITPPLSEGVLNGTTRKMMLMEGRAQEDFISIERLMTAQKTYLANSMTGLREVIKIIP